MRTAGIREVRQNITALLEHVKKGREITITDRGKPVARLVSPKPRLNKPFPDLTAFRKSLGIPPSIGDRLIEIICEDRNDRV